MAIFRPLIELRFVPRNILDTSMTFRSFAISGNARLGHQGIVTTMTSHDLYLKGRHPIWNRLRRSIYSLRMRHNYAGSSLRETPECVRGCLQVDDRRVVVQSGDVFLAQTLPVYAHLKGSHYNHLANSVVSFQTCIRYCYRKTT